jgi:hypothetical protein
MAGTPEEKKEKPANGTLCALTSPAYMGDPKNVTTDTPEMLDRPHDASIGSIRCQRFLGGLLRHHSRDAA